MKIEGKKHCDVPCSRYSIRWADHTSRVAAAAAAATTAAAQNLADEASTTFEDVGAEVIALLSDFTQLDSVKQRHSCKRCDGCTSAAAWVKALRGCRGIKRRRMRSSGTSNRRRRSWRGGRKEGEKQTQTQLAAGSSRAGGREKSRNEHPTRSERNPVVGGIISRCLNVAFYLEIPRSSGYLLIESRFRPHRVPIKSESRNRVSHVNFGNVTILLSSSIKKIKKLQERRSEIIF
jgi:hypothetical protein